MMNRGYLEVTYRHGKVLAAYLNLDRHAGDRAVTTQEHEPGVIVDYAADGRPIGIEITSPRMITLESLNRVLLSLNSPPITADDLRPLAHAG